jgi:hypothetical protein
MKKSLIQRKEIGADLRQHLARFHSEISVLRSGFGLEWNEIEV